MIHRNPNERSVKETDSLKSKTLNGDKPKDGNEKVPELGAEHDWILDELAKETLKKRLQKIIDKG